MSDAVNLGIGGKHLLTHPFYKRWEAGTLLEGELGSYAEQYRHIESALPAVLTSIEDSLPSGTARDLVSQNLNDELNSPMAHVELFEMFATRANAKPNVDSTSATRALVNFQQSTASDDPIFGLSVLAAYELQAAEIAQSKGDGLRKHFGFDEIGTRFWDVHTKMEESHADWSLDALAALGAEASQVCAFAKLAATYWWEFLDERNEAGCRAGANEGALDISRV